MQTKQCTKCLEYKPFNEFYNNNKSKNGKTSCCKKCSRSKPKQMYFSFYKAISPKITVVSKFCSVCEKEKSASEFYKMTASKDNLAGKCKVCQAQYNKKWNSFPEKKEKAKKRTYKWMSKNMDKVLASRKKTEQKRKNCAWVRISHNLQKSLVKKTHFRSPIGFKGDALKPFIESLFENGMNWQNYGKKWYISRKCPIHLFDLTNPEEVKKINHYTNLHIIKKN